MPFLSSMRLGCCGLNSWSLGMGIFSQGFSCCAGRAMGASRAEKMAAMKIDFEMRIPSGAKARVVLRQSMYGLKPVPFKFMFIARLRLFRARRRTARRGLRLRFRSRLRSGCSPQTPGWPRGECRPWSPCPPCRAEKKFAPVAVAGLVLGQIVGQALVVGQSAQQIRPCPRLVHGQLFVGHVSGLEFFVHKNLRNRRRPQQPGGQGT